MARGLSILHVVSPGSVGGLERVVHGLAIGHAERGHDVHVAIVQRADEPKDAFMNPLRSTGVVVHPHPVGRLSLWREVRLLRETCRRVSPDLVHTHGYRPDLVDSHAARSLDLPTVATEHGMSRTGGRTTLYEWLQMRTFRSFDAVVAVSRPIARELERSGVRSDRIHLIPNSWSDDIAFLSRTDARRELGIPADSICLGWVGRQIEAKGGDVFLRALAGLEEPAPEAVVIGDGPKRSRLTALCAELGLVDRVRFVGEIEAAARYLPAFDVFVSSSRTEGTPVILLEAMAAGVPIVASSVGGVPDMMGSDCALLVPSDSPTRLADGIREALIDPKLAYERAERARVRLREFHGREAWLDLYTQVYRGILRS